MKALVWKERIGFLELRILKLRGNGGGTAGGMGCVQSTSTGRMKNRGPVADTGGVPVKADPEVHPEILQLAEVSQ